MTKQYLFNVIDIGLQSLGGRWNPIFEKYKFCFSSGKELRIRAEHTSHYRFPLYSVSDSAQR